MNSRKRYSLNDALELITAGDQSEVSNFSDDEESEVVSEAQGNTKDFITKDISDDDHFDASEDDDEIGMIKEADLSPDASSATDSAPGLKKTQILMEETQCTSY